MSSFNDSEKPISYYIEEIERLNSKLKTNINTISTLTGFHNWKEDFSHENGNYQNICLTCNTYFIGHKRRVHCKVCANANELIDLKAKLEKLGNQLICIEKLASLDCSAAYYFGKLDGERTATGNSINTDEI